MNPPCRHVLRLRCGAEGLPQPCVFSDGAAAPDGLQAAVEAAMQSYWRALVLPPADMPMLLGGRLQTLEVRLASGPGQGAAPKRSESAPAPGALQHARPADDEAAGALEIGVRCSGVEGETLRFHATARGCGLDPAQGRAAVAATVTQVLLDPQSRHQPVPALLRDWLQAFEEGAPMLDVRVGGWAELGAPAHTLRSAVFVQEQGIPASLEWDAADAGAVHAVAFDFARRPVATGRLLVHAPGVAKIGRMAVARTVRGTGGGRAVLDALLQAAARRGDTEAVLHAQQSAAGFYARHGFEVRGSPFEEAGIAHVEMARRLAAA